jgi:hypothetical protein
MAWTELWFGKKYKDKTLPQIIFRDPDWFFWAIEKGIFHGKDKLEEEAAELYLKARHIKIPQDPNEGELVAEYGFHHSSGKFAILEIVPATQSHHTGSTPTYRKGVIDFGIVREQAGYDKMGYRLFIKKVKFILFGNLSHKMTKKRCEAFFEIDDNFDLPKKEKSDTDKSKPYGLFEFKSIRS